MNINNEEAKRNKVRIKIANFVSRKPEIDTSCCICGKKGIILHNPDINNPYFITFLCWDCRKNPENLEIAEQYRVDIRTLLDKTNLHVDHFTDQQITQIVVKYMNDILSISKFCQQEGLSRHQFSRVIERYNKLYPKQHIDRLIEARTKKVRKYLLGKNEE